jgi:hypothetical protein
MHMNKFACIGAICFSLIGYSNRIYVIDQGSSFGPLMKKAMGEKSRPTVALIENS